MGAAVSNNVAKQIITTSTEIANSYIQNCTGTGSQVFGLDVSNGCVSDIGSINIANTSILNVKCVQNTTTSNSMRSDIQAQILQQATAAAQSIGGPSVSFANAITDFSVNASNVITNLYTQTCVNQANQSQNIKCTDPSSKLTVGAINIDNTQTQFTECSQNSSTINDLVSQLASIINSETNAKEADTLAIFVIVGIIFLAIIGIGFVYTSNGPIGWIIVAAIAIIIVALIVYAAVAFSQKLYPFNQKTNVN